MADSKFSSPRPSAINNNLNQNVITFFIGIVVLFLVRWFGTEFKKKRYNLPPRPKSFPIIGNLPQIIRAKEFFRLIMEYRNNYGEIFKISIGPYITVYVSDFDIVKEALVIKGEFLKGRPTWLFIFKKIFRNQGNYIENTAKSLHNCSLFFQSNNTKTYVKFKLREEAKNEKIIFHKCAMTRKFEINQKQQTPNKSGSGLDACRAFRRCRFRRKFQ